MHRLLGIEPEITRSDQVDPGYDGIYRGWTFEVRGTTWEKGKLLYNSDEHHFKQDAWILAVTTDDWERRIAGWLWREEMQLYWYWKTDQKVPCWAIDQWNLEDFSDFIEIKQK